MLLTLLTMGAENTRDGEADVGNPSSKTAYEWLTVARRRNVSLKLIEGDGRPLWVREKDGHFYLGVQDVHPIRPICNIDGVDLDQLREYIGYCEVEAIEIDTTYGVGRSRIQMPQD